MDVLFDLKLSNGELIQGVYFVEYHKPIKGGKNSIILTWSASHMDCFDSSGQKIVDKNFANAELVKAYDQETKNDVTEFYKTIIKFQIDRGLRMADKHPFAREVVKLNN